MKFEYKVSQDAAGQRLDKFLRKRFENMPLSHLYKLVRTKKVRVNGARADIATQLKPGDEVVVHTMNVDKTPHTPKPAADFRQDFGILYEDEHILVCDKPAGLAIHPGSGITGETLVDQARAYFIRQGLETPDGEFKPSPAHRLDRETSGVVVVAKTRQAMVKLTEIFTEGEAHKTYLALAKGKMPREAGTIDLALSEHEQTARSKAARGVNFQEAVTRWKVLSSMKEASLLAVTIETGRTHQIRRHLEAVGHPVAGDRRYGDFAWNRLARQRWGLRRMFLHAWRLELPHPGTGAPLRLEAPLPPELAEVLSRLNLAPPPSGASARREAPPGGER